MIYRTRYAATVSGPIVENAAIEVRGGRIVAVERAMGPTGGDAIDFADAIILPGLINAHAHLELTHLHGRVPFTGRFTDWAMTLGAQKRALKDEDAARASIRAGAEQSLRAGVTTVGDIGYGRHQIAELRASPLRAVCFMETLGIGRKRRAAMPLLRERLGDEESAPPACWLGISPHAPYSTDESAYRACLELARRRRWPICTHLAETLPEREFLLRGKGEFRRLLNRLRLLGWFYSPPRCAPVEFARRVGLLDAGALLVHVNYLTDDELEVLARAQSAVAFCPRTHRFFGHQPHRFREMLAAGISVCLGTDSLASNDTLSVLDECRFLLSEHPELPPETVLRMATYDGARALGLAGELGSLEPGKLADFIVLPLDAPSATCAPVDALRSVRQPTDVLLGGEFVIRDGARVITNASQ